MADVELVEQVLQLEAEGGGAIVVAEPGAGLGRGERVAGAAGRGAVVAAEPGEQGDAEVDGVQVAVQQDDGAERGGGAVQALPSSASFTSNSPAS